MIRIALAALAVFFAAPALAWELEDLNRTVDATNFVVNQGCSGTLISVEERLILTNYHCIDRNIRVVERERVDHKGVVRKVREERRDPVPVVQYSYKGYETVGSSSYVTEIVAHRKNRDLAILQIKADTIPHTYASPPLAEGKTVKRGERVFVVGNPAGLEATVVEGVVSSVNRTFQFPWAENEDLPMIQFSGGIFGGNSGGALYNNVGELIGVPAAGLRGVTFIGLAIPIGVVKEVLRENCLARVFDHKADDEACRKEAEAPEEEGEAS
jgi:S1-C subfamily serine protease